MMEIEFPARFEIVNPAGDERNYGWFNPERRPDIREELIRSAETGAARGHPSWVHDHPHGEPCADLCVWVAAPS